MLDKNVNRIHSILIFITALIFCACNSNPSTQNVQQFSPPDWSYDASIYEVNVRQFTDEGTLQAFEKRLPELKELGVKILWFMPLQPIGEKNRKGGLGSYYSIRDYQAISPAYGAAEEFAALVKKIHANGMFVMIDWVANHTAWDHHWTLEHPEWYTRDTNGNFTPPVADWSDVIDLNYDEKPLWNAMIEAMAFWVREFDVDGFRCDVAGMVPLEFWLQARKELEEIKPLFMLAEAWEPELHQAFDMTYSWSTHHLMKDVAQGQKTANALAAALKKEQRMYGANDFRMQFTTNHDENSWNGTVFERLGDAAAAFAVFSATIPGMPLIYSGQEAGLNKRLAFFEKDRIDWREHPFRALYRKLIQLKRNNTALWNGKKSGAVDLVSHKTEKNVLVFSRENDVDQVIVAINFKGEHSSFEIEKAKWRGSYSSLFDGEEVVLDGVVSTELEPWGYLVLVRKN